MIGYIVTLFICSLVFIYINFSKVDDPDRRHGAAPFLMAGALGLLVSISWLVGMIAQQSIDAYVDTTERSKRLDAVGQPSEQEVLDVLGSADPADTENKLAIDRDAEANVREAEARVKEAEARADAAMDEIFR